ncbi:nitrous oxide-stimulated promoter family protein [Paenibacillus sp. ACRRX]|uniref:nitrous oxide-stimulated promoter family protein n=1 Tax=Paenibacillus sp. ACRRX TaxID=2918206 RepID=UPI001EF64760|nr:nitrous oxide-stimulated promoter family protein [Paenibacillus sp. ACRRX]MCG7408205.1 nitrous oxide-stimulated promoter family protein [Paenibacillus sp. ACRRX]
MGISNISKEKATLTYMIRIYCCAHHQHETIDRNLETGLCDSCAELTRYAYKRLSHCQFGENKPTCGKCPIHCYKPDMREHIKQVMRYAGPRMVYRHPIMAIRHLISSLQQPPALPEARQKKPVK